MILRTRKSASGKHLAFVARSRCRLVDLNADGGAGEGCERGLPAGPEQVVAVR